jgi:hypothetical protein
MHIEINRGRLENDIDRQGLKEAYVNMNGCKRWFVAIRFGVATVRAQLVDELNSTEKCETTGWLDDIVGLCACLHVCLYVLSCGLLVACKRE